MSYGYIMKNKKAINNSDEKKEDDKLKKNDLVNPNEIASISNLCNNILLWPGPKYITNILITQEE
jgi:hypothetical protein